MEKGVPIQIFAVGNGWVVRRTPDFQNPHTEPTEEGTLVFNELGIEKTDGYIAMSGNLNERTLIGFLLEHFKR